MKITVEAICKEFDIRAEDIFAFMDEENIELGGSIMHDISFDPGDFRKFIEYWRRHLKQQISQAQTDLDQLDAKAEGFIRAQKGW
ncbi:MAG: hypothetical protein ACYC5A_00555 [Thermoleophilia bacterium]